MSELSGISMSTIAATSTTTTGSHLLKFEGYELIKKMHGNGQYVESCGFEAAGHTWKIYFYPNGKHESYYGSKSVSLELALDEKDITRPVHADVKFSLLRRRGRPHTKNFTGTFWNARRRASDWREDRFIDRNKLERRCSGFLEDDCFTVRCDITVLDKWSVKTCNKGVVCGCTDDLCKRCHVVKRPPPRDPVKAFFNKFLSKAFFNKFCSCL